MIKRFVLALVTLAAVPTFAQLAAPNDLGVSAGHVHLAVRDIAAQQKFFGLLGGKQVQNGALQLIQFPGIFINLRQDMPVAGTEGSVINHFGFHVKNLPATLETLKPLGLKVEQRNPQQAFVTGPDDVRVELLEDAKLSMPIEMHHIHMIVLTAADVQAWYGKVFGAVPGKRGTFDTATIPGAEIAMTTQQVLLAPTKGRSLDHIGFEVKSLDATLKRLDSMGIKIADGPKLGANGTTKIAFFYDPWGTYIEVHEGISPK